jgi:ABC-type transporter Mla subunit MlaD
MTTLEDVARELAAQRRVLNAILAALQPPDDRDPAQVLVTILSELAAAVDDQGASVATLASTVSRLSERAGGPPSPVA